jgi:hypothetical protein
LDGKLTTALTKNLKYKKGTTLSLFLFFCSFLQSQIPGIIDVNTGKKSNFGFELMASVLPPANIRQAPGNFKLKSRIQSSYDVGINYIRKFEKKWSISAGLHFTVGKWNYFRIVPGAVTGSSNDLYLEFKELWGSFRLPLMAEKQIRISHKNFSMKAGLSLHYSGLMADLEIGSSTFSSNPFKLNAEFPAYKKPWLSLLMGFSRDIVLKNNNLISAGLLADISRTWFLKGNYRIYINNRLEESGIYKINGTSLGISLRYTWTGANKLLVKRKLLLIPKGQAIKKFSKKELLGNYVFKGNHFLFDFSWLSVFGARLKQEMGNYPVKTSAYPGILVALRYSINRGLKNSIVTGAEMSIRGYNLKISVNKNDFSPPLKNDFSINSLSSVGMILSVPVSYESRFFTRQASYFYSDAGLKLNFSLGYDSESSSVYLPDINNQYKYISGTDLVSNNDQRPWISFPLSTGYSWLLKNNNLVAFGLSGEISFTKYVNGRYEILVPNKHTGGRYFATGSYLGLNFRYVFTNANNRIRKVFN